MSPDSSQGDGGHARVAFLGAHAAGQPFGGDLAEPRHGVLAVDSHFGEPGEMIDAGGRVFHRIDRRLQGPRQIGMDLAHAVAKSDHVGAGRFADRAADGRHGVAVIEKERCGRQVEHVLGNLNHGRDHPQRARASARHDGVAHRLIDAVFAGDEHVLLPGPASADADGGDHDRGVGQHVAPVGGAGKRQRRMLGFHHLARQSDGKRQGVGVDVDQGHFRVPPPIESSRAAVRA